MLPGGKLLRFPGEEQEERLLASYREGDAVAPAEAVPRTWAPARGPMFASQL